MLGLGHSNERCKQQAAGWAPCFLVSNSVASMPDTFDLGLYLRTDHSKNAKNKKTRMKLRSCEAIEVRVMFTLL